MKIILIRSTSAQFFIYVSFSTVKSILNVRLSEATDRPTNMSILELPGDVLIVPQVSQ